jgi:hypothetical protein
MKTEHRLNIIRISLNLINDRRINLAYFDAAINRVDIETDKLFSIQRQFGTQSIDARLHMVIGIVPEILQHFMHGWLVSAEGNAFPKHKTGRHLDDRKS